MKRRMFEYIVVGCGGIGSATMYWLSRAAGDDVLGLEQYRLGHDKGGSEDHSRIIRLSYHTPEYTALTPHTYDAWREAEQESGVQLVFKTGGLDLGAPGDESENVISSYAESMRAAGIPFEELTAKETQERYPQFALGEGARVLYQPDTGLVDAGKANAVHVSLAQARGATVLDNTPVREIRSSEDRVEVLTDEGAFLGRRLIVAAGAWTNEVLSHFGVRLPITLTQEQVTYFRTPHLRQFAPDRFPVWMWHGENNFYGFPVYGEVATKAGQDVGGDEVTLQTRTFEPNPRTRKKLRSFLERHIPSFLGPELYTKTCLYDMPPDRNFVIDALPDHPHVYIVGGAGHAYKFAGVLGRIMSELATTGQTSLPVSDFGIDRPALTDPNFEPAFTL